MEWINSKGHIVRYDFADMLNWSSDKLKQAYFDLHEAIRNRYAVDTIEAENTMLSITTELERRGNTSSELFLIYELIEQMNRECRMLYKLVAKISDRLMTECDKHTLSDSIRMMENQEKH